MLEDILKALRQDNSCPKIVFGRVYISEKKRTQQTANIVLAGQEKDIIIDGRINEINFGIFEGNTYEEICKLYPKEQKDWQDDWIRYCPPNGESFQEFYNRVRTFMEDIRELQEENILVVTHGGVIRAIYSYILGEDMNNYWKFSSKNGDVTLIKYEHGNMFIDSIVHMGE